MDEPTTDVTPEVEGDAENEVETSKPNPSRKEEGGGGWVRGLIWLIVLALIAWGGYIAYKNRNAASEASTETATTTATTATGTPAQ